MIYLLRHGDAEDGNGEDSARRLTSRGEDQARTAGRALAALTIELDACLTSPKVRAADTARLTGAKAKLRKGGLAVIEGSTLVALLRPRELRAIARPTS